MILMLSLVFVAEICNATGQTFFKKSANTFQLPSDFQIHNLLVFFRRVFTTPWIWLGLGSMGVGLIFWITALSKRDLSFVYPLGSIQYLMVLISARLFLKEKIDSAKITGTVLIIIGILFIAQS